MSDPNQFPDETPASGQKLPDAVSGDANQTPSRAAPVPDGVVALKEVIRLQLFELYKKFRYNDLAFSRQSRQAYQLEGKVRWSVLITLAISLLTDIIPGMDAVSLRWVWGVLGALATVLTIYAMSVQSGEQQFKWFELAKRARSWASKLESFTAEVEYDRIGEKERDDALGAYNAELNAQFSDAGPSYIDFEARWRTRLTDELIGALRSEGKAT